MKRFVGLSALFNLVLLAAPLLVFGAKRFIPATGLQKQHLLFPV